LQVDANSSQKREASRRKVVASGKEKTLCSKEREASRRKVVASDRAFQTTYDIYVDGFVCPKAASHNFVGQMSVNFSRSKARVSCVNCSYPVSKD
jgi:hypothetical protein